MSVPLPSGLPVLSSRGFSSIEGTQILRNQLTGLFYRYSIQTMFDAGARDAAWQIDTIAKQVIYSAGEIDNEIVEYAKKAYPTLNICQFDITRDSPPSVDLLFVRDVTIHLNTDQKEKFVNLWLSSNIPYLLISHNRSIEENKDFEIDQTVQFADVNWQLPPWSWPDPLENLWEMGPNGRSMSLWHQSQIKEIYK